MITVNSITATQVVTSQGKIPVKAFEKSHKELEVGKSYIFTLLNDKVIDYRETKSSD